MFKSLSKSLDIDSVKFKDTIFSQPVYVDKKIPNESVFYGNIRVKLTSTSSSVIKWCEMPPKDVSLEEMPSKEGPTALSVGSCKGRGLIEVIHKNKVISFISCFHIISVLIIIVYVVVLS